MRIAALCFKVGHYCSDKFSSGAYGMFTDMNSLEQLNWKNLNFIQTSYEINTNIF